VVEAVVVADGYTTIGMASGFGFKYDVVPASELGYTTVWVNRQGEARPLDVKETFLVGDMRTLAYLVTGIAASFFLDLIRG
jgi:FMN phosphatase YigB (HAD superfamily)